jgi:hypothetical protein
MRMISWAIRFIVTLLELAKSMHAPLQRDGKSGAEAGQLGVSPVANRLGTIGKNRFAQSFGVRGT